MKFNTLIIFLLTALAFPLEASWHLSSPDGTLEIQLKLDNRGRAFYQLARAGGPVIQPSPMGIQLDGSDFQQGLEAAGEPETNSISDSYRLWTGKKRNINYSANQIRIPLRNVKGDEMAIVARLSNDGLAFRYEIAGKTDDAVEVKSESSGFHFFPETQAWLQPKADAQTGWSKTNPSYEEDYLQEISVGTPSPTESGWVYPALFRYGDHWLLISETGMDGRYSGTNLAQHSEDGLYRVRFPQKEEVVSEGGLLPQSNLPFHTPWRLILVGDLANIIESTLGTDLAEPSILKQTDFIKPGISAWSWGVLKDDYTIYPVQKDFIDYASDMNWPYVLVDADWDQKIGYKNIVKLVEYADSKDVSLLLWYNSSGDWNETIYSPKSKLLTRDSRRREFARLKEMGIKGVKVDFFAGDGRSVIRYYMDILEDAADFGLVVNTHGSTLPRGLHRTYPNFLTSEAIKGFEFLTFEQANTDREATHSAMAPFTRNVFDPMDFTPMVLGDIPDRERRTSNGFQLALPVLFTSGIQHLVTTPEQMQPMPEFVKDYLRNFPAQWDETRFIDGFPGRFVVIARRAGQRWYVAGINAETEPRQIQLDLGFTAAKSGQLITDGANWREPATKFFNIDEAEITLPHGTGFVMILEP